MLHTSGRLQQKCDGTLGTLHVSEFNQEVIGRTVVRGYMIAVFLEHG